MLFILTLSLIDYWLTINYNDGQPLTNYIHIYLSLHGGDVVKHVPYILSIPDAGHSGCSLFAEASWFCQISGLFPVNFSQSKLAHEQEEVIMQMFFFFLTMSERILRRCRMCIYIYVEG